MSTPTRQEKPVTTLKANIKWLEDCCTYIESLPEAEAGRYQAGGRLSGDTKGHGLYPYHLALLPTSGASADADAARPLPVQDGPVIRAHDPALEVHFGVALPLSDDEEKMDSSTSRKRQQGQANSDDEDGPRKQPVTCPATAAPSSESAVHSPSPGLKSPEATERAGLGDDPATAASPMRN
ncbi:hypothetical protein MRX96_046665 [Rhipicephalus microplus]